MPLQNRTGIIALALFGVFVFKADPHFGISCLVAAGVGAFAVGPLGL
jgi:hypothetical protein